MVTESTSQREMQAERAQAQPDADSRAILALEGMTCASCAMRIEKSLKKVPGVKEASVNFATEQATVTYNSAETNLDQMVQKVDTVGYKAIPLVMPAFNKVPTQEQESASSQVTLALEGMTCASCVMRIEKGLKKVPGVENASVNLATERATVTYNPQETDVDRLVQKVEAVGYRATPLALSAPQTQASASATVSGRLLPQ